MKKFRTIAAALLVASTLSVAAMGPAAAHHEPRFGSRAWVCNYWPAIC